MHARYVIVVIELQLECWLGIEYITPSNKFREIGNSRILMRRLVVTVCCQAMKSGQQLVLACLVEK